HPSGIGNIALSAQRYWRSLRAPEVGAQRRLTATGSCNALLAGARRRRPACDGELALRAHDIEFDGTVRHVVGPRRLDESSPELASVRIPRCEFEFRRHEDGVSVSAPDVLSDASMSGSPPRQFLHVSSAIRSRWPRSSSGSDRRCPYLRSQAPDARSA